MAKFRYVDPDSQSKDPFVAEKAPESEFEALLATDTTTLVNRKFRLGEQVQGMVISVGQEYVFIDLGGKNAGALSLDEYKNQEGTAIPKVGEAISAYVREDNGSEVILTKSLRRGETDDLALRGAYENHTPVEAKVEKVIKGGFEAILGGKRAFVPMGQMDNIRFENPDPYVGSVFKFYITEYKQSGRSIVLSRKALLHEEQAGKQEELLNTLEVGQSKKATITRLAAFGAFADIGGIDGLIPISELSWTRVKKIEDVVKPGDVVNVKIIKIERSPKLKIGLSLKDAGEDPWVLMAARLIPGTVIEGTVARLADIGAFVSVSDGIDGLVHISQMTWEKRIKHPSEAVKVGDKIKAHVLSVDLENHKLSLSIKGPMPDDLAQKLKTKRDGKQELTVEEQEQAKEWDTYKQNKPRGYKAAGAALNDGGVMAAAFAKAGNPKK